MDFWGALVLFFIAFLVLSCCGWCCSRKQRGAVLSTPVVVTSSTHTAPGGYPVHQTPGAYQTNVYASPAPYPMHGASGNMPMPMPMHGSQPYPPMPQAQPYNAPYPPMPMPAPRNDSANPPSYDMAVAGGPAGVPNNAGFEKQAPYNPSFTAQ